MFDLCGEEKVSNFIEKHRMTGEFTIGRRITRIRWIPTDIFERKKPQAFFKLNTNVEDIFLFCTYISSYVKSTKVIFGLVPWIHISSENISRFFSVAVNWKWTIVYISTGFCSWNWVIFAAFLWMLPQFTVWILSNWFIAFQAFVNH